MSKKFKIKQNPTFKSKVDIPVVGGNSVEVEFDFKYLTRKELAKLYDDWHEKAKELNEFIRKDDVTLVELTNAEIDLQVCQVKDIVVGWDMDDEFNDENIEQLVDISVNIVGAITTTYQKAYTEAKLGN